MRSCSPGTRVPRSVWNRKDSFPDEAAYLVQLRDTWEASYLSPRVNLQVADPTLPQKNRVFAARHHEQQGKRGSGSPPRSEQAGPSLPTHLVHRWTLPLSPGPLQQSLWPFEMTSPDLKFSHVYFSVESSERLGKGHITTRQPPPPPMSPSALPPRFLPSEKPPSSPPILSFPSPLHPEPLSWCSPPRKHAINEAARLACGQTVSGSWNRPVL